MEVVYAVTYITYKISTQLTDWLIVSVLCTRKIVDAIFIVLSQYFYDFYIDKR